MVMSQKIGAEVMNETRIITNHHWRKFRYRDEVPQDILDSEFNYQTPEDCIDGFIHYRGLWYHLDQFMRLENTSGWDGAHCDSFFSAVLIKLSDDGEEYQIALQLC